MKKSLIVLIVLFVLALAVWGFSNYNTQGKSDGISGSVVYDLNGEELKINSEESLFEFTGGKAIGKSHVGTFESWEGKVYLEEGNAVGIKGVAQVNSVKTDSETVDKHLQRDDFFDAENYPEIKFTSTNIDYGNSEISGVLEIREIKKELTFPANFEEGKISGEFSFEAEEFFKYDILITDIGIKFEFIY